MVGLGESSPLYFTLPNSWENEPVCQEDPASKTLLQNPLAALSALSQKTLWTVPQIFSHISHLQLPEPQIFPSEQLQFLGSQKNWQIQDSQINFLKLSIDMAQSHPEDPSLRENLSLLAKEYRNWLLSRSHALQQWQDLKDAPSEAADYLWEGHGAEWHEGLEGPEEKNLSAQDRQHLAYLYQKLKSPKVFDLPPTFLEKNKDRVIDDAKQLLSLGLQLKEGHYEEAFLLEKIKERLVEINSAYYRLAEGPKGYEKSRALLKDLNRRAENLGQQDFKNFFKDYQHLELRLQAETGEKKIKAFIESSTAADEGVLHFFGSAYRLRYLLFGLLGNWEGPGYTKEKANVDSSKLYEPVLRAYEKAIQLMDEGKWDEAKLQMATAQGEIKAGHLEEHNSFGQLMAGLHNLDNIGTVLTLCYLAPYLIFSVVEFPILALGMEATWTFDKAFKVALLAQMVALPAMRTGMKVLEGEEVSWTEVTVSFLSNIAFLKLLPKGGAFESLKNFGLTVAALQATSLAEEAVLQVSEGKFELETFLDQQSSTGALLGKAVGVVALKFQGGKEFLAFAQRIRGSLMSRAQARAFALALAPNRHGVRLPNTLDPLQVQEGLFYPPARSGLKRDLHRWQRLTPESMAFKEGPEGSFLIAVRGEGGQPIALRLSPAKDPSSLVPTQAKPQAMPAIYPHPGPAANQGPLQQIAPEQALPLKLAMGADLALPAEPANTCEEIPLGLVPAFYAMGNQDDPPKNDPKLPTSGSSTTSMGTSLDEGKEARARARANRWLGWLASGERHETKNLKQAVQQLEDPSNLIWAAEATLKLIYRPGQSNQRNLWIVWQTCVAKLPAGEKGPAMDYLARILRQEKKQIPASITYVANLYKDLSDSEKLACLEVYGDLFNLNFSSTDEDSQGTKRILQAYIAILKSETNPKIRKQLWQNLANFTANSLTDPTFKSLLQFISRNSPLGSSPESLVLKAECLLNIAVTKSANPVAIKQEVQVLARIYGQADTAQRKDIGALVEGAYLTDKQKTKITHAFSKAPTPRSKLPSPQTTASVINSSATDASPRTSDTNNASANTGKITEASETEDHSNLSEGATVQVQEANQSEAGVTWSVIEVGDGYVEFYRQAGVSFEIVKVKVNPEGINPEGQYIIEVK